MLLSLDTSSKKTGWALFHNQTLSEYGCIDLSAMKKSENRIEQMVKEIWRLLSLHPIHQIVVEELKVTRNMRTTKVLSYVIATVYVYAVLHDIEYDELSPSQWRSTLGLQKNKAKRDELKSLSVQYVKQHYQIDVSDDISDAICIGESRIKRDNLNSNHNKENINESKEKRITKRKRD